jgi:hypothetical protein
VITERIHGNEPRVVALGLFGAAAAWAVSPIHPPLACPLRSTTGIPCPMCGMTRACAAAVRGDLVASVRYNPMGIVLLLCAAVVVLRPNVLVRLRPPVWAIVALGAAMWVWNVGFNPTFHQLLL